MTKTGLRGRAILAQWLPVIIVFLAVFAVLGGWFTFQTYVDPGVRSEEVVESTWSMQGNVEHSATVVNTNPIFPVGERLSNRPVYFRHISPILFGNLDLHYTASQGGNLQILTEVNLIIHAVGTAEVGEDPSLANESADLTEFWRVEKSITDEATSGVAPGQEVSIPFHINITEIEDEMNRITGSLGGSPGETESIIEIEIQLDGTVNGNQVSRTLDVSMPIGLEGAIYRPQDPDPIQVQNEQTRTVTVEDTYGPLRQIGAPALLLLSIIGLFGIAVAWTRGIIGLSPEERELLDFYDDRSEFDEWVSTIRLPEEFLNRPRAEAGSFGDLADFAIDTENSVIENPADGTYYVNHEGYLFTYTPPALAKSDISTETADRLTSSPFSESGGSPEPDEVAENLGEPEHTGDIDETGAPPTQDGSTSPEPGEDSDETVKPGESSTTSEDQEPPGTNQRDTNASIDADEGSQATVTDESEESESEESGEEKAVDDTSDNDGRDGESSDSSE